MASRSFSTVGGQMAQGSKPLLPLVKANGPKRDDFQLCEASYGIEATFRVFAARNVNAKEFRGDSCILLQN